MTKSGRKKKQQQHFLLIGVEHEKCLINFEAQFQSESMRNLEHVINHVWWTQGMRQK